MEKQGWWLTHQFGVFAKKASAVGLCYIQRRVLECPADTTHYIGIANLHQSYPILCIMVWVYAILV